MTEWIEEGDGTRAKPYIWQQFTLKQMQKMSREEYEKTADYFCFFLTQFDMWAKDNTFYTPSSQDHIIAEELGLKFIGVESPLLTPGVKKWTLVRTVSSNVCVALLMSAAHRRDFDPEKTVAAYGHKFDDIRDMRV